MLAYNEQGQANILLPLGSKLDSFRLTLFVQIIDNLEAVTVYTIPDKITSVMKNGSLDVYTNEILTGNGKSNFSHELFSGDFQLVAKNAICFLTF